MKNLTETAKTMDIVFKVLDILAKVAFVGSIVGLCIIAVGFIFDLDPEMIGTGYGSISIGSLELEVAEGAIPDKKLILVQVAVDLMLSLVVTFLIIRGIGCIRSILQRMVEGTPFFSSVGDQLQTLAKYCIILGIAVNATAIISTTLWVSSFDLEHLLLSEKITAVTIQAPLDATFLLAGAILLLLSYIFRHGEQLQQLSDETL